jgi:hypothetical protein
MGVRIRGLEIKACAGQRLMIAGAFLAGVAGVARNG